MAASPPNPALNRPEARQPTALSAVFRRLASEPLPVPPANGPEMLGFAELTAEPPREPPPREAAPPRPRRSEPLVQGFEELAEVPPEPAVPAEPQIAITVEAVRVEVEYFDPEPAEPEPTEEIASSPTAAPEPPPIQARIHELPHRPQTLAGRLGRRLGEVPPAFSRSSTAPRPSASAAPAPSASIAPPQGAEPLAPQPPAPAPQPTPIAPPPAASAPVGPRAAAPPPAAARPAPPAHKAVAPSPAPALDRTGRPSLPRNRRLYRRVKLPAEIEIAGMPCGLVDVSIGGFAATGVPEIAGNSVVPVTIRLTIDGIEVGTQLNARIIYANQTRSSGRFIDLTPSQTAFLRYIVTWRGESVGVVGTTTLLDAIAGGVERGPSPGGDRFDSSPKERWWSGMIGRKVKPPR